jgi:16S rRNA (guanine527-N7)-methyltransferase
VTAAALLDAGLHAMAVDLSQPQRERLLDYLGLMQKWNRSFNLTAVRDPGHMVTRHLLDSLTLMPFMRGSRIVDVGTGAGLPGLPLAVANPDRRFVLLDSNGKKTRFLEHVKLALGIDNIEIVRDRVEDYRPESAFDVVLSRAFATLGAMIDACRHLPGPDGEFQAMKGHYPSAELDGLPADVRLLAVESLSVPGLAEERCLVRLALSRDDGNNGFPQATGSPETDR